MNSVDFFSPPPRPPRQAECFLTLVRLNILLICQLSHYHGTTFFEHFSSKTVSRIFVQLLLPPANKVWDKVVFHRCLTVHKGGVCLWVQRCASGSGVHTPWTPPPRKTHTHTLDTYIPWDTPWTHPLPWPGPLAVNERAVRILLECFLVIIVVKDLHVHAAKAEIERRTGPCVEKWHFLCTRYCWKVN